MLGGEAEDAAAPAMDGVEVAAARPAEEGTETADTAMPGVAEGAETDGPACEQPTPAAEAGAPDASTATTTTTPATTTTATAPPAKNVRSVHHTDVQEGDFEKHLHIYYTTFFPHAKYFKWLSYGKVDQSYFSNRELSFSLSKDGREIYTRYRSFGSDKELRKAIIEACPTKIDIGAIFTHKPKDHLKIKASEFKPVEKELVFDIDMTDYDEIRTCCSGAAICTKCWPFMNMAIKVVDLALREDFGFEHLLWVYSGRRGVHCWVCDKRARTLSQEARSAVAEYLNLIKGGGDKARKVTLQRHHSVQRAIRTLEPYFLGVLLNEDSQDILGAEGSQDMLLRVIGDDSIQAEIKNVWEDNPGLSPKQKWEVICEELQKTVSKKSTKNLSARKDEIMLQYTYPRLDINVSKQLNHLLKSPWVVHPKTGRVCVPIDSENVDDFNPFEVPTLTTLCNFLDDGNSPSADLKNTPLAGGVNVFNRFLKGLDEERRQAVHERNEDIAMSGSW